MVAAVSLWRRIVAYASHDDPLAEAANWIALVVAWNQPFYPLYLCAVVDSDKLWPSLLTFLSTPFFLAVPALSRRNPVLSRAMLVAVGSANTVLSARVLGVASGVEMFFIPCALIAAALFRPQERKVGLGLVGLDLALYLGLHGRYGAPLAAYTPGESAGMLGLNALSVATLTVFIGLLVAGAYGALETKVQSPGAK